MNEFSSKSNFLLSIFIWFSFRFLFNHSSYAISNHRIIVTVNETIFGTITNDNVNDGEWLFVTNDDDNKFINIHFIWINLTGCNSNDDIIYIFDGDSFEDNLLANIRGPCNQSSQLKPLTSNGNRLLMIYHHHHSSFDLLLPTFILQYSFTKCPLNCSNHGQCIRNHCECNDHYYGNACDHSDITINNNCPPNHIGSSCQININDDDSQQQSKWTKLFSNHQLFSARASHASVYDDRTDQIFIFGGRNYETIHSDLLSYSIRKNEWINLTDCDILNNKNTYNNYRTNYNQPKPRWGHTMNIVNDSLIIFGGIGTDGHQFNDFWIYNLTEGYWIQPQTIFQIPPIAFHVAIIVDQQWLYIHGGRFENSSISSNIYRINLLSTLNNQWESLNKGRKLAAHTAIFYNRSILIFGGIDMNNNQLQNTLYQYNVDDNYWSIIRYHDRYSNLIPRKRALHSMLLLDNDYLMIFGGFIENDCDNKDDDDGTKIYLFSLKYRYWIMNDDHNQFPFESISSHTMIRRKNFLFIFGGYYGQIRDEILVTRINHSIYDHDHDDHQNSSELTICKYFNVPNISMPDEMIIVTEKQQQRSTIFHYEQMIRIFSFIHHPLGSQTFDNNILRIYLRSGNNDNNLLNSTFDLSFVNNNFIDHIIRLPIRMTIMRDRLDFDHHHYHNVIKRETKLKCAIGTYEDNSVAGGRCLPCDCNGHGDPERGICNPKNGYCFCRNNTEGSNCNRCSTGYYGQPKNGGICFEQCQNKALILNATFGYFGSYLRSSYVSKMKKIESSSQSINHHHHCMWIISTGPDYHSLMNPPPLQITIFKSLKLNCSHSTLIIYDGVPDFILQNQKSLNQYRILASICGPQQQQQSNNLKLIANTGIATILYKTDNNFEQQQGFNASYQSMENDSSSSSDAKWPQNSHQLYYFNNHLIFIGGHIHTLNLCLTLYSFDDDRWIQLDDDDNEQNFPTNRYLYSSTMIDGKLYVYGGLDIHTNQVLAEFWSTSIIFDDQNDLIKWINLTATDSKPPPLIGHTLTRIQFDQHKHDVLILIGGYSPENGYSSNQYVYLMKENQWILLKTKGPSPLGIIGHSTVYHRESGKIFIFGGLDFKESHKWAISNTIYQLDCHQFIWHRIQPRSVLNSIIPLYLHQAFTLPNYMLIFGGKKTIDYRGRGGDKMMANNHDDPISYAYFYKCNRWIAIQNVSSSSWSNVSMLNNRHRHSIQGSSWSITIDNQRILYRYESSTTKNQPWSIEKIQLPEDFCEFFSNDQTQCLSTNGCSYCRRNSSSSTSGICFDQSLAAAVKFDCFEIWNETSVGCITKDGRKECNQFTNCVDCTTVNYEVKDNDNDGGGCQWCADCHMANGHCIKMNDTCQQWDDDNDHSYHNNEFVTSIGIGTATGSPSPTSTTICLNISIIEMKHCSTRRCLATDCQHCLLINQERRSSLSSSSLSFNHQIGNDDNGCIWTKQVYKFIRFGHHLAMPTNPIFDWACIESSIIRFSVMKNVPTIPPLKCPKRCSQYHSCQSCLEETFGDESDSHECLWSELTGECMSSIYSTIKCQQNHQCGGFIYRLQPNNNDDDHHHQCPPECETFEKANDCLSMLHCGWCAVDGLPIDGVGFCLQGDLQGPKYRHCSNQSIDLLSQLKHKSYYVPMKLWKTSWYYLKSPNENECLNGHHNCNQKSQICIDLIDGFMCQCKNGYRMFNDNGVVVCKPICQQGCLNGQCIEPNICQCNFGYIGHDCSIECQCNGHSLCPSSDRRYECIQCENNTQGKSCEQCKPFFIGNPTKPGEKCQSCSEFCHNHSEFCFSQEDLVNLTTKELNEFNDTQWFKFGMEIIRHGPISPVTAQCINCKNNTDGNQCEHCKLGYFKISDKIEDGCRQCMCNNHGSLCNPFNGENCDCHNNTENDRQCNYLTTKEYSNYINKTYYFKSSQIMTTYSLPCWMLQCTKCKDYFYGQPSNGHQCYRHMFLDKEYCLNSIRQENCIIDQQQQQQQNPEQNQLLLGRTIFFAIQPRYMNVDLKLIIFNVDGMIDLYLASKEDIFIIHNDPLNGFHRIFIDKKYIDNDRNESSTIDHVEIDKLIDFYNSSSKSSDQTSTIKLPYKMTIVNLNESSSSSYFTMKNWYEIFIVKNVQNRLEITIPYRYHDLRTTRYYLMIYGSFLNDTNNGDFIGKNQANIVVRQDQSRIDLFIFFCVFISCFFLFLSMSIMFWRLKQIIFIHHTRQLQQMELQLMANRPMATITILLDDDNDDNNDKRYLDDSESLIGFRPYIKESITPPSSSSKQRHRTIFHQLTANFKESPKKIYPEYSRTMMITNKQEQSIMNNRKRPSPSMPLVSLEPTFDGSAAILTTFIQFPHNKKDNGNDNSNQSLQMAAASTLISLRNCPIFLQQQKLSSKNHQQHQ